MLLMEHGGGFHGARHLAVFLGLAVGDAKLVLEIALDPHFSDDVFV